MVRQVAVEGVRNRGWTRPKSRGNNPSRDIANQTRACPSWNTSKEEIIPIMAPNSTPSRTQRSVAEPEAGAHERQELAEQQADVAARQIEERVMAQVRLQLADLVVTAVERVTRGALDASSQRGLVQQFLSANGTPGGTSSTRYDPNPTR